MVISANSEKVTSTYYLIDLKTGAITEMGTITTSVDTEAPVVASAFAADKVDSTNKTDLLNEKFVKFESTINVFITGEETGKAPEKDDDKKNDKKDDTDKKESHGGVPDQDYPVRRMKPNPVQMRRFPPSPKRPKQPMTRPKPLRFVLLMVSPLSSQPATRPVMKTVTMSLLLPTKTVARMIPKTPTSCLL